MIKSFLTILDRYGHLLSRKIGACLNKSFGGIFGMPTYMPVVNEDNTLRVVPRPVGIRKWLPIKYLSGTFLCLDVVFCSLSDNEKTIKCEYNLFRLSGANKKADFIKGGQDSFGLKARGKLKRFWGFCYLPQSGEYSVTLRLIEGTNKGEADLVYFDALLRDATLWRVQFTIMAAIIGAGVGAIITYLLARGCHS